MIEIKTEGSTINISDLGDITIVPKDYSYAKKDLENTVKEVQNYSAVEYRTTPQEYTAKIGGEWRLFKDGCELVNFSKRINELEYKVGMITNILGSCRQEDFTPVGVLFKIQNILKGE